MAYTGGYEPLTQRALSYLFGMTLIFIIYRKPAGGGWRAVVAAAVCLLAVASISYPILRIDYYLDRLHFVEPLEPMDLILGTVVLVLAFEAARRTINLALPLISLFFVVYSYFGPWFPGFLAHKGATYMHIVDHQYMTYDGLWTAPLSVFRSTSSCSFSSARFWTAWGRPIST